MSRTLSKKKILNWLKWWEDYLPKRIKTAAKEVREYSHDTRNIGGCIADLNENRGKHKFCMRIRSAIEDGKFDVGKKKKQSEGENK